MMATNVKKIESEDSKSVTEMSKLIDRIDSMFEELGTIDLINLLKTEKINWYHIKKFKAFCNFTDYQLSEIFQVSIRTLRSKKSFDSDIKILNKEQVILLISLFKQGTQLFGTSKNFELWLDTENFFFDYNKPFEFLKSISGIRFIEERLVAMKYGDNV